MIEMLKIFSISEKEISELVDYKGLDVLRKAHEQKKNVILLAGHNFNWELAIALQNNVPQENFYGIYKKLESDFWDQKIIESRAKFGVKLLETKNVMRHFFTEKSDGNSLFPFLTTAFITPVSPSKVLTVQRTVSPEFALTSSSEPP